MGDEAVARRVRERGYLTRERLGQAEAALARRRAAGERISLWGVLRAHVPAEAAAELEAADREVEGSLGETLSGSSGVGSTGLGGWGSGGEWPIEVLGELGRGGMGVVYRVLDRRLQREAALKVLLEEDPASLGRFRWESEVTAQLDHPAIPPVYEAGRTPEGRAFLLMRRIRGEPLDAVLKERGPTEDRALLEALARVADGVAHAHARGVVHRDLKPSNLMLGEFGEVLVLDWGVATRAATGEVLTLDGSVVGTLGYMPPEQADGLPVDGRADVFALGAVLHAILTGAPPVTGSSHVVVLRRTLEGEVTRPRDVRPGVSRELDALAAWALAADPEERLGEASWFAEDLRRYIAGDDLRACRYGRWERVVRAIRRRPSRAVGALALCVSAAVCLGAWGWVSGSRERERGRQGEEAERAWSALGAASAGEPLGVTLERLQQAERWHALVGGEASRVALVEAAMALGEAAWAEEEWSLAGEAFRMAEAAGGEEAGAARAAVEEERSRGLRVAVEWLDRARSGGLEGRAEVLELAGLRVANHDSEEVAAEVIGRLNAISDVLRAEFERLLRSVEEPRPEEAAVGAERLVRLGEELEQIERSWSKQGIAQVVEAQERLERRSERWVRGRVLVGEAQGEALGARVDEARVCCVALGYMAPRPAAEAALGRYARLECGAERAEAALLALVRLGTKTSWKSALSAATRFEVGAEAERVLRMLEWSGLEEEPELWVLRAEWRRSRGELDQAYEASTRALALDPGNDAVRLSRAALDLDLGRLEATREALEELRGASADRSAYWALWGHVRMMEGKLEEAEEALERALLLRRADPVAWTGLGHVRARSGKVEAALEAYRRAETLSMRSVAAMVGAGRLLLELGRLDELEEGLARWVRWYPEQPELLLLRVNLLWRRGQLLRATAELEPLAAAAPTNGVMQLDFARLLAQAGAVERALEVLREYLERRPGDGEVRLRRAQLLGQMGRLEEAREEAERVVRESPAGAVEREARGLLGELRRLGVGR